MKKIFALILAIAMMASMSVVVFAAENATDVGMANTDSDGKLAGGTTLTYGVDQTYTITIPADQTFAKNGEATGAQAFKATADIVASDVKIKGNQTLTVSITSANGWELVDTYEDSDDVVYTAHVGTGEALANNAAVLEVTIEDDTPVTGADKTSTLNFYTAGTAQVGNYQDQLTFTVAID